MADENHPQPIRQTQGSAALEAATLLSSNQKFSCSNVLLALAISLLLLIIAGSAGANAATQSSPAEIVRRAAQEGKLAYKLTTPEELKALLGPAEKEAVKRDGGMDILDLYYPGVRAQFGRMREFSVPFTLLWINAGGKGVDIGQERQLILRNEGDLNRLDTFWGYAGVSLARLDLRSHLDILEKMPFDSRTVWPESDKMPMDFNPATLLEEGKNPGLGVRSLHEQGIDGRGVTIAIIDQPLLKDHQEYADRWVEYEPVGLTTAMMPPQMHGPDVYTFDRTGGMSWAAPYMAGLAALAYQVKPDIDPKTIVDLWLKTAMQTDVGPIINPVGFIEAVRKVQTK
ncbi:MAG: hypothetical protein A2Z25_13370 [Planctomycetes bacterium RBG_16_55_9]|nr:MAG: hypothetical protein A2Z25_13370 [Planctomycetes bacterium RBG_16_55_9]